MREIVRSIIIGCLVGYLFFAASLSSILMVMGNGSAPAITYFMLALNEFPFKMLGIEPPATMVILSTLLWGGLAAFCAYILMAIRRVLTRNK